MQVSLATTDEDCTAANQQYEIKFKANYDDCSKRVQTYENNNTNACALLWERCNKAMKNKIEVRLDYIKIKNNPITLLIAIKEHKPNYQENRYSMSIIFDAMRSLLTTKQRGESLQDYTKRLRVAQHVRKFHIGGPIILNKFVKAMEVGYDKTDIKLRDKFCEQAFSQFLAYLYLLDNADKTKYGSILIGLA
jgi:hypothetical protein